MYDIELKYRKGKHRNILIAAPHHCESRNEKIGFNYERPGDKYTGKVAELIADKLECGLLICKNYFIDPNKYETSDYYNIIDNLKPSLLVEIHGHGSKNNIYEIEIASQRKTQHSEHFSQILFDEMKKNDELDKITICGKLDKIYFTAPETLTIQNEKWIGIHIELPIYLRQNSIVRDMFIDAVVKAIKTFMQVLF
ncbi:MAG: hypothetical protein JXR48_03785 [Candidatus Delongbacteria bacterium]|nr:hypothetical protein [Candidatus Delongbacteria bacterium]MBN2834067.1 hypothetical protein [Candidatus Delongbacteria bacterium]